MARTLSKSKEPVFDDIKDQLALKRTELLNARKGHANGELANPHVLKKLRKQIARLLTSLNQQNSNKEDK